MDFCVVFVADNVTTDQAVAMGNGINISWDSYPDMTCGYIVKWCRSSGSELCSVDWQKFPSNTTNAVIKSGKSEIISCESFWLRLWAASGIRAAQSYRLQIVWLLCTCVNKWNSSWYCVYFNFLHSLAKSKYQAWLNFYHPVFINCFEITSSSCTPQFPNSA